MSLVKSNTRDPASVTLVAGLVLAAVGLVIQVISGVPGFPTIPPGPIILVVAAAFVALAPWRWAPIVGLVTALFLVVGAVVAAAVPGIADRLGDPGEFGPFAGTALYALGLLVALVAGVVATKRGLRRR